MAEKFNPFNHFGFLTHRVARLMDLSVAPTLKEFGYQMPASCIGVLADLWQKDGVTQKELGASIIKTKSSVTKMLSILENEGLIIKKDDPKDKRNRLIFLTQEGKNFRKKLVQKSNKIEKVLLHDVPEEEIQVAKRILKNLYLNLSEEIFKQKIND